MNSPTGETRPRIFTLDGSNDADSRRDVPFGGFVNIAPHFGDEIPRKPQFWGVNRRFQAKRAKYWKFHVIETTASISTKFWTTIETIKWSSWVIPIGAQQIEDGGRPPFWKKTVKSPYLCNRLTDFDEIWQDDAYFPPTADRPLKFRIFENSRWRRPSSWKSQKSRYLRSGLTDTKFGTLMQNVSVNRSDH